ARRPLPGLQLLLAAGRLRPAVGDGAHGRRHADLPDDAAVSVRDHSAMLDSENRTVASDLKARWKADYDRIAARFADQPAAGEARTTHSGIPLKPCYFPED